MARRISATAGTSMFLAAIVLVVVLTTGSTAQAQGSPEPVDLGTADAFAVLGGETVTNTGPTRIRGDLGVHPGSAVVGFPPGIVNGTIHAADGVALQAKSDLTTAYLDAEGRFCDEDKTGQDLGGQTLTAGVYCFSSSVGVTGTLTLNGQGNPDAVFIFQIGSTLVTAPGSSVNLINGAQACNIFWQVGSSATLDTTTAFQGNILALTSIELLTGATLIEGRALARNGSTTMDTNIIRRAICGLPPTDTLPDEGATTSA